MAFINTASTRVILASQSPRRIELLKKVVTHFEIFSITIDENNHDQLPPLELVKRLALQKAEAVVPHFQNGFVIGADSVVVLEDEILGKPVDAADSARMLRLLSGKQHQVYTGFSIINIRDKKSISDYEVTDVRFRELDSREIDAYIDSGQPLDKAGSYGIQDDGAVFVHSISGCYYNVVGLPVTKLYLALKNIFAEWR